MSFVLLCLFITTCMSLILSKHSKISSGLKILAAVLFTIFCLTSYDTIRAVSGYPTVEELPEDAEIVWARVVEEEEKYIEVWILFERSYTQKIFTFYHKENPISRVYRIGYTKKRHELLLQMLEGIKQGKKQGIRGRVNKNGEDAFEEAVQSFHIESERRVIRKR